MILDTPLIMVLTFNLITLENYERVYIFSILKVKAKTRVKAYDLARAKAIRIKNDLDLIELNEIH
jgi:hypothetical protein